MKLPLPSPGLVRAAALPLGVGIFLVSAVVAGVEIGLLVGAFLALSGVIALLWGSVQSLTGDSPLTLEEALTLGAPSVEEEQKRAVLRALKDLEYERSVGKIGDEDYAELSARYREEAKRLIQLLDESLSPARERAEKLVAERLAAEVTAAASAKKDVTAGAPDDPETAGDDDGSSPASAPPAAAKAHEPGGADEGERT